MADLIPTTNLDSGLDSPAAARTVLLQTVTRINELSDIDARMAVVEASNTSEILPRLTAVETGQSAAVVGYATRALLYADLVPGDKAVAYVTNDATAAYNGTYRKSGATGTGSWVQSSFDRVIVVENRVTETESDIAAVDGRVVTLEALPPRVATLETTAALTSDLSLSTRSPYAYALRDSNNKVAIGVRQDGTTDLALSPETTGGIVETTLHSILADFTTIDGTHGRAVDGSQSDYVYGIKDSADKIAFGIKKSGEVVVTLDKNTLPIWSTLDTIVESADSYVFSMSDSDGNKQVYRQMKSTGITTQLTSAGSNNFQPILTMDSSRVVFRSDRSGVERVYSVPLAGGAETPAMVKSDIVCWGDSLTAQGYPAKLSLILGRPVTAFGYGGENSTQIAAHMAATPDYSAHTAIIWVGRNNAQAPEGLAALEADLANMVDYLTALNKRFLIMTVINGNWGTEGWEGPGTNAYNYFLLFRDHIMSTYPNNFLDIRAYLVSQYDPGIPQDVNDYAHDTVPASLRSDPVHLNTAGYQLVAEQVANFITSKGW